MSEIPSILLNNGRKMPVIGFGTYSSEPEKIGGVVENALTEAGYRNFDCALLYQNEKQIGQAFKKVFSEGKIKREDIFVTSKLWCTHHRPDCVRKGFNITSTELCLDYLDLYLIHWPIPFADTGPVVDLSKTDNPDLTHDDYLGTWKEMEKLVDDGLVKSIGISNFNSKQLQRLLDNCRIKPAVAQIESHVFLNNQPLIDLCHERGLAVTVYGVFASPELPWLEEPIPRPLESPVVKSIGDKYNKTPGQVLLRHAVQRNLIALTKSSNVERMKENKQIFDFELSPEDMATLNGLNTNQRVCHGFSTWKASEYFPWPDSEGKDFF